MTKKLQFAKFSDAEFLRHLAQNDYMIDQFFTEAGYRLLEIAIKLEANDKHISRAMEMMDNEMEHWRKSQNQD